MGCVSSALLNHHQQEDFRINSQMGGGGGAVSSSSLGLGHHIVCLTSSTYGRLLSLDPPLPISSSEPEIINSWELMAGLDSISNNNEISSSFRCFSRPKKLLEEEVDDEVDKENSNPNLNPNPNLGICSSGSPESESSSDVGGVQSYYSKMKVVCGPPKGGEEKVVVYTTSLGTVRKTLEDCKAVKAVLKGMGVAICERDISMDIGWRQELRDLLLPFLFLKKNCSTSNNTPPPPTPTPPRVFIKGRYLGGAEEFMRIVEQGLLPDLLQGLPKFKFNTSTPPCCGGVRFVPCLSCNGSCKKLLLIREEDNNTSTTTTTLHKDSPSDTTTTSSRRRRRPSCSTSPTLIVPCPHCNENGLMLCPICS